MTVRSLCVAIVGAGLMGSRHAEAFRMLRGVDVTDVFDLNADAAAALAQRTGARSHGSLAEMLAAETDIVVVATGDRHHREPALAAIAAGRHVLIEKPLAAGPEDARAIDTAARATDRIVAVGHQLRFDPRYAGMADWVARGDAGSIIHAAFRRNSSIDGPRHYGAHVPLAGHVLVHDIELLQYITGERVTSVIARGAKKASTSSDYDSILTLAEVSDGSIATFEACWALPQGAALDAAARVIGTNGSAVVETAQQGLLLLADDALIAPDTMRYLSRGDRVGGLLVEQAAAFVGAVDTLTGSTLCTTGQALHAVEIADAVERSLVSGERTVVAARASQTRHS